MNLLLIEESELAGDGSLWLEGRRARHLIEVLRVAPGRRVRAGIVNGRRGQAEVLEVTEARVRVRLTALDAEPEPRPRIELVVAMPRPKALRRLLRAVAALGVARLELTNAWRVEKSYFETPLLEERAIREALLLGCEQGGGTRLSEVAVHRLLRPFLEGLPSPAPGEQRLLADPCAPAGLETRRAAIGASTIARAAIGPERGFIDRERESFLERGFIAVSLGPRTLTTEVALAVLVGQLQLLARLGDGPGGPSRVQAS